MILAKLVHGLISIMGISISRASMDVIHRSYERMVTHILVIVYIMGGKVKITYEESTRSSI